MENVTKRVYMIKELTKEVILDALKDAGMDTKVLKKFKVQELINRFFDVNFANKRAKNGRYIEFRAYSLKDLIATDVKVYASEIVNDSNYDMKPVTYFNRFVKENLPSDEVRLAEKNAANKAYKIAKAEAKAAEDLKVINETKEVA